MYRMSEAEFMQCKIAERRLQELYKQHEMELQRAYDGIHPTRTCFDYEQGAVYSESVNPAEYAIYLAELREEHKRFEKWWQLRSEVYKQALDQLTDEEKQIINLGIHGNYAEYEKVGKKLREHLNKIFDERPDLQRQSIPFDELEDIEEVDRIIDKMSMKELLEDYWDLDKQIDEEVLKEQCVRLYESYDMTFSTIGKKVGITTNRVKKYVMHHQKGMK